MIELFSDPSILGLVLLGTILGITVGAVPGLTGTMLIALSLPLTFSMEPVAGLVLLVAMYVGAVSGGLISATLLRMPGTPAAVMTTLDGYPMAISGRPGRALGLGAGASLFGGLVSWLALWQLSEPMADWSTKLGPFELFSLVVLALALLAGVGDSTRARGLLAGSLGVLVAMPGMHPATGELRWTLGMTSMNEGFRLIPVLIGMFAIGKILEDITGKGGTVEKVAGNDSAWIPLGTWRKQFANLFRSSGIGTLIGVLPGVGANIGSLAAYMAAKRASAKPEDFGKGSEDGIVASESANNATVGGALIPLIALGVPGSVIGAVLLGALIVHGLQPGPLLFRQNPDAVHAIIGTVLVANLMMYLIMVGCARWIARLSFVPKKILFP
ncbi:MAG: tripartite tricarboxylate transporter permease, partial [Opitutae bacterium]